MQELVCTRSTYEVSTSAVEKWLQNRINNAVELAKNAGKGYPANAAISLKTFTASSKFYPFIVTLAKEAVDQELEVVHPCLSEIIVPCRYSNGEKEEFRSLFWQTAMGVSDAAAWVLFTCSRMVALESGEWMCLLDPRRVFSMMLKDRLSGEYEIRHIVTSNIEIVEETIGADVRDAIYTFEAISGHLLKREKANAEDKDIKFKEAVEFYQKAVKLQNKLRKRK